MPNSKASDVSHSYFQEFGEANFLTDGTILFWKVYEIKVAVGKSLLWHNMWVKKHIYVHKKLK